MIALPRCLVVAALLFAFAGPLTAEDQVDAQPPAVEKPAAPRESGEETPAGLDRAALEKEFTETLSGCQLVGFFSVTGQKETEAPKEERYTIANVKKLKDDLWLFATRIQYGKTDVTVPLALTVTWAGDTPVITLTDFEIPGLGKFTSRVMIFRGRYAGTWQHDAVGGHLWGRIEKLPKKEKKDAPDEKPQGAAEKS